MKNIKIATQLQIGLSILLSFVIVLGIVSYFQNEELHLQTETIYNHPLNTRRAIGQLKFNFVSIHRDMKDLFIAKDNNEIASDLDDIEKMQASAFDQIDSLYICYLGPKSNIDDVKDAFVTWNTLRQETLRLYREGKIVEAANRTKTYGIAGSQVQLLFAKLKIIDDFAINISKELFATSNELRNSSNQQLLFIVVLILLLSLVVNFILLRNIRKPLNNLKEATQRFQNGDLSARTSFVSKNEFGKLSSSFNSLAEQIQLKTEIDEKFANLTSLMLSEYDIKNFFQATINALASHTGSQMAAIYLLSDDKQHFKHFESTGVDDTARQSFSATSFEGEFGAAISSHKVHHLKNIPDDTRFVFHTITGKFIPHEIITIPILANNEVVAIISLATIDKYSPQSVKLIDRILVTLCARVEGILAYHKTKELLENLHDLSELNQKIIDSSTLGIFACSADGPCVLANEAVAKTSGGSLEAVRKMNWRELKSWKENGLYQSVETALSTGQMQVTEVHLTSSFGKDIWIKYYITTFTKSGVLHFLMIVEEISDRKNAEVELLKLNEDLRQKSDNLSSANLELESQKAELATQSYELIEQNTELEMQKKQLNEVSQLKTSFLSNMSHELRTPLNSVIALSSVLNRRLAKQIPDEEYSYLEIIERNGKNLLTLINDILDISRIESGHEEVEITKFNAVSLLSEVVSMIKPQAKLKGIELIQSETSSELMLTNDSNKCRHILQNVIGNAVKFTETGKVEVKAVIQEENIKITVTDTGIGIANENISHIFDEFRQADGSTSRKFGGTGLGLAIAKKYTNMLGGEIQVKSTLGEGSEFSIILPLEYNPENKIVEESGTTEFKYVIKQLSQPFSKDTLFKTVLVVEDSEPAIIQIKDILEESGFKVLVAHNGNEALGIIANTIPDAMILDLMMPGIDGFELLKTIRNEDRTANIPVLVLTAKHITKGDLKFLKRNNIHQLIQKGDVNRRELLNAVASMVFFEKEITPKPEKVLPNIIGKPVVLVVEDNVDNMITVKALLSERYIVIEATDGNLGVALAKEHKPHLILMDIALPEMDGIMAFKEIRKDIELQHIPIVALTASAMTNDREAILAHGFDAYIAKPIDQELFLKTINETLYGK